ncbi:MAG TPA: hypothetical protein VLG67_01795 [Candidatus Saccharimonadales bacterium]|nr:hypothetical protein [Candidatus Saccharimonadales bacterium]
MDKFNNLLNNFRQNPYLRPFIGIGLILTFLIVSAFLSQSPRKKQITQPEPSNRLVTTVPKTSPTPLNQEEQIRRQTKMDEETAKKENELYSSYPWYDKLPLKNTDYFVYFDTTKKSFVGLLYPDNSSPNLTISQTVTMKAEIRKSLTDLGINITKYGFEWVIKPESKNQ